MSGPARDRLRSLFTGERAALLLLLLALGAVHLGLRGWQPAPVLWGDESHYWAFSGEQARLGRKSILPGSLPFDHRPQLATRFFAWFHEGSATQLTAADTGPEHWNPKGTRLLRNVTPAHIALFLVAVAALYASARLLGLRARGALVAAALVGTSPQLGFHVHSLWPETLHLFLFSLFFLALLAHLRSARLWLLAPAGVFAGYALLAKGSLQPYLYVLPFFLSAVAWCDAQNRSAPLPRRLLRALLPPLTFCAAFGLVVLPQLAANERAGHGRHLSANRWWNLELGLTLSWRETRGEGEASVKRVFETSANYWLSAETPLERERLARERTLEFIAQQGVLSVAWDQLVQTAHLLFFGTSSLEQSVGFRQRWGSAPPGWLRALAVSGRVHWFVLLALTLAGLFFRPRMSGAADPQAWARSPRVARLALWLFVASFGAALALVPVKFRFLLPLVPALCLTAVLGAQAARERLVARRAMT